MEFTARYVRQGGLAHYAVVTLRVEATEHPGVVNQANLEEPFLGSFVEGLGDLPETFEITLLEAKVHKVDSTRRAFLCAGRDAAMRIHAGFNCTKEPDVPEEPDVNQEELDVLEAVWQKRIKKDNKEIEETMLKSKLVLEQIDTIHQKGKSYRVVQATNRTNPKIGDDLTETEVKRLLDESRGFLTVDIKGKK